MTSDHKIFVKISQIEHFKLIIIEETFWKTNRETMIKLRIATLYQQMDPNRLVINVLLVCFDKFQFSNDLFPFTCRWQQAFFVFLMLGTREGSEFPFSVYKMNGTS